jgi:hypothetical protein
VNVSVLSRQLASAWGYELDLADVYKETQSIRESIKEVEEMEDVRDGQRVYGRLV